MALSLTLAADLRRAGAPAHRVEDGMDAFVHAIGVDLRFHVLPAAILANGPHGTTVLDVAPGNSDLHRIAALEALVRSVRHGVIDAGSALDRLAALRVDPGPYGARATLLAFAVASASAVPFFGGGPVEVVAATALGLLSGALSLGIGKRTPASHLVEVAAAAIGAFLVAALAHAVPVSGEVVLTTGLIVLLPGFTLTTALTELATGHRLSGTAGLAAGTLVLLELGFGTALGARLAELALGPTTWVAATGSPPPVVAAVALAGVGLSFAVLLRAPPAVIPHVLGASALAVYGREAGAWLLGPDLAGGVAAFAVTVVAHAIARRWGQPVATWQVPGLLLLVPGSIGYRSVTALLHQDPLAGLEGAFATALAAMSLVGGSLFGAALVPPPRRDTRPAPSPPREIAAPA